MFFSPTCQYAIRALIHLAGETNSGPVLARSIAEGENIPQQFLSKILHSLSKRGLVVSTKGPGGGYQLAKLANQISVHDIAEVIDGPIELDDICALGLDKCSDSQSCPIHRQWKQFKNHFQLATHSVMLDQMARTLKDKRKNKAAK